MKLLRVLETRRIMRVGGRGSIRVNIRVIAATNRDLKRSVSEHRFREDLYYRLTPFSLCTPPLRNRREDIPALARHFLLEYANEAARRIDGISPEAEAILREYWWPGNVRELQNVMRHAVVMGEDDLIGPKDLPEEVHRNAPEAETYLEVIDGMKRQLLKSAFESGRNYKEVAELLRIHPNSVRRQMRNFNLTHLRQRHRDSDAGDSTGADTNST